MQVNITYRGSINAAAVAQSAVINKSAPLTNAEIDGNFKSIQDALVNFNTEASQITVTPTATIVSTNVQAALEEIDSDKQDTLVSGTNIKTVGGETLLGAGNIQFKNVDGHSIIGSGNIDLSNLEIQDTSTSSTTGTWSAKKIHDSIDAMGTTVTNNLLGGVGGAYDTLQELADALASSTGMAEAIVVSLAGKQDTLVDSGAGANFKTVEGQSLIGAGNIDLKSVNGQSLIGTGDISGVTIDDSSTSSTTGTWSANKVFTEIAKKGDVSYTGTGAFTVIRETFSDIQSATNFDLSSANVFLKNMTAATTFSFSNAAPSGKVSTCIVELTNNVATTGTAYAATWPASVKWAGGTAPTLTAGGVDILGFYTRDGGATYRGLVLAKNSK